MNKHSFFMVLVILMSLIHTTAYACWMYLSASDLIQKSDTVIIGVINEKSERIKLDMSQNNKMISWQVNVKYYLKGDKSGPLISVLTPPQNYSTHYELDMYGTQILLFMDKNGDAYSPLSQQAVIPIEISSSLLNNSGPVTGEELANGVKIIDPRLDDNYMNELTNFLNYCQVELPGDAEEKHNPITMRLIVFAILIIVSVLILVVVKLKYKKKSYDRSTTSKTKTF